MLTLGLLAVAAAAAALAWWLSRRRPSDDQSDDGYGGSGGSETGRNMYDYEAERRRREAEERQQQNRKRVREILDGDPELAQMLLEQAGQAHRPIQQVRQDQEAIRKIADTVPELQLQILSLANRSFDQFESIELDAERKDQPVPYPTNDIRMDPLTDLGQLPGVMPDELALPDDLFYAQLADDGLHVMQAYDTVVNRRRLYILLDVSGSMDGVMTGSHTRIAWAAGVALKLLLRAKKGEAEFLLRYFDGETHQLRRIQTPAEADGLIRELLRLQANGGGTDVQGAIRRATNDLRSDKLHVDASDILVITDGESDMEAAAIKRMLGDDIRLHVAVIGLRNEILQAVAADTKGSYHEYS
jgi:uncharacterized protein with von Willebrand factor type A (vWA) domain